MLEESIYRTVYSLFAGGINDATFPVPIPIPSISYPILPSLLARLSRSPKMPVGQVALGTFNDRCGEIPPSTKNCLEVRFPCSTSTLRCKNIGSSAVIKLGAQSAKRHHLGCYSRQSVNQDRWNALMIFSLCVHPQFYQNPAAYCTHI